MTAAAEPRVAARPGAPGGSGSATGGCHGGAPSGVVRSHHAELRVTLVGAPNVGKSALFNRLTGAYVAVSNFPGTSVEITRGRCKLAGLHAEVVDTPGLYSLLPATEEERVAQRIVLSGEADVLVHVADAKTLERSLPLTLQLAELGRPVVLALNMMDEARRLGIRIDARLLATRLGLPVVPVVAVTGEGVERLSDAIERAAASMAAPPLPPYANGVGTALAIVRERLSGRHRVDPTGLVTLALQGDSEAVDALLGAEDGHAHDLALALEAAARELGGPAVYRVAFERQRTVDAVLEDVIRDDGGRRRLADGLGRLLARPLTGLPILALVLYIGLYQFVGQLGAGTLVDALESGVFERWINPFFESLFAPLAAWPWAQSLFVGEYGILTLGLRYAVAIILPVVGSFFLFFSVLEDSGYFPRLALLLDRSFKRIGLSGRAVIPMVLGFACDTMATMVTRTLETRRERVLATLLLALAIPCSAQLGVILAVLSGQPAALAVWGAALVGTFLLVGAITARLLPGETASFHMELPPLRRPRLGNVLTKTYTRMHWYFLEVLPLFLFASVLLWAGSLTGVLERVVAGLGPVVRLLGLPAETAAIFLFGFFRRDYGAAGLFDLSRQGLLDPVQLTVAAVTLTLFVPCVAQFLMMMKERGLRTALGMFLFITPFAFGVGLILNLLLRGLGW